MGRREHSDRNFDTVDIEFSQCDNFCNFAGSNTIIIILIFIPLQLFGSEYMCSTRFVVGVATVIYVLDLLPRHSSLREYTQ